jgi:hypothetical protein
MAKTRRAVHRLLICLVLFDSAAVAGGPKYIAGSSYFNAGNEGTALTWPGGMVNYYTDQGDLSPLLPGASADAFVAGAFAPWTGVSAAAVAATRVAQLGEDVNGSNVYRNSDGTITMPADILPTSTKPVAIVYDADGAVTDALLGTGAGGADECFWNAVTGSVDNFSPDAHLAHALIVLDGNCAQTANGITDLNYRLVRTIGRVLGLDWSQVNINVITRKPVAPTTDDYDGFPVMHNSDLTSCIPITRCYATATQLKMDDRAAISRLYPVTSGNQSLFPGKQLLTANTGRVYGSVYFSDGTGAAAEAMSGVNVVARWIDPATGLPSHKSSASSVSGFSFRGYAGNPVTGFTDNSGVGYDQYGSSDSATQGFFDLNGLEFPNGGDSAQYQISVEAVDPAWSAALVPYGPWQVSPSGTAVPVVVTVTRGGSVQQNLVLLGGATQAEDIFEPDAWDAPNAVPSSGDWSATLSGYGDVDYRSIPAQANRTLSVAVTALDESHAATETKALPVIGIWSLDDPPGTDPPSSTPFAFNQGFALTRLDTSVFSAGTFRIGIADFRGDGRPDYAYHAHVLYGDTISPARSSTAGNTILQIAGIGFQPGNTVMMGTNLPATVLALGATQLTITAPAVADGQQNLTITDPSSGSFSLMTNVLTVGAGPTDSIRLIAGSNPGTPVGIQAANPIVVRALDANGIIPVGGATVVWSTTPAAALSACVGASTCPVLTDESGYASTRITPSSAGTIAIKATLAPASYSTPKSVQTTLVATSSSLDLGLTLPSLSVANGATLNLTLTSRVLANGSPINGRSLTYQLIMGSGTLDATNLTTDGNGYASTVLHLVNLASEVKVVACVQPGSAPCQTFDIVAVPATSLRLEPVANDVQAVAVGHAFQPMTLRVTDGAATPSPVLGASVLFTSYICRAYDAAASQTNGDLIVSDMPMTVVLGLVQSSVTSDANGLAVITPSAGAISGAVEIEGIASVAGASLPYDLKSLPPVATGHQSGRTVPAKSATGKPAGESGENAE